MVNPKTKKLADNIISMMKQDLPIRGQKYTVTIEDFDLKPPTSADGFNDELIMKYTKEGMKSATLTGRVIVRDNATNKIVSKSGKRGIVKIPAATERGTYIINGTEKHILSQMRRNPGAYTNRNKANGEIKTIINFDTQVKGKRVPNMHMKYQAADNKFSVHVMSIGGREEVFNGIVFLKITGFSDGEIRRLIGNDTIADELFKKYNSARKKTIHDLYKAVLGADPVEFDEETGKAEKISEEEAKNRVESFWKKNGTFGVGAEAFKQSLGTKNDHFDKQAIARAVEKTFKVYIGEVEEDDSDDLRFKSVIDDNDFITEKVRADWERFVRQAQDKADKGGYKGKELSYKEFNQLNNLDRTLMKSIGGDNLVQVPEETNPLFVASMQNKISQLGTGGISDQAKDSANSSRNTASGSVNRIDPVETPESGNVGFIEHLSQGAKIEDRTIKSPVYKVTAGKAKMGKANEVYLSPQEEYNKKVAFFDTRYVKANNGEITFLKQMVPARYQNKDVTVSVNELDYVDTKPQNLMGYAANMIPFVQHNDGNRTLMGSNMQKQAITLVNREKPLVTTLMDKETGKTYDEHLGELMGKPIKSPCNGRITSIKNGVIRIRKDSGGFEKINFYDYYPLNRSFINNDLLVKAGDTVKKGQLLAEGWQTKDGALALGTNTRVAYLPFKGYNYEDGIVVSKSYAKKMTSEHMEEQVVDIRPEVLGGIGSGIGSKLPEYTRSPEISRLDKDGVIKVGEYVKPGDVLVATLRPVEKLKEGDTKQEYEELLSRLIAGYSKEDKILTYEPIKIASSSYQEGYVKRITKLPGEGNNKQKIVITLVKRDPLKVGDKISGRHGNKGTITKIVDDEEMPEAEDGKPIDLLFSPLAVPSRKNVGQLFEVNAGLVAEKTGKPFVVENFNHKEKDRVMKELKKIGYDDGKMKVHLRERQPDGTIKKVKAENPVTVGNMYVMKLDHRIDDKVQSRYNMGSRPSEKTFMPSKSVGAVSGEKTNPQRLGGMEMWALQSHGAVHNMLESSTIKADGGGDVKQRIAIFNALATGKLDGTDVPATPGSLHHLSDNLKALGLNLKPVNDKGQATTFDDAFSSVAIDPFKSSDLIKMIGEENRVTTPMMHDAKDTFGTASKAKNPAKNVDDKAIEGGLFDPKIFGEDDDDDKARKKWGYIKLAKPVPNPMLMESSRVNPYSTLTGMSKRQVLDISKGQQVVIRDPDKYKGNMSAQEKQEIRATMQKFGFKDGDVKPTQEIEKILRDRSNKLYWTTGGEAIHKALEEVDLNKTIKDAQKQIRTAKGINDVKKAYNNLKFAKNLQDKKMKPTDLMMDIVPVAPRYMRPARQDKKKGAWIIDDLNDLYAGVVTANQPLEKLTNEGKFESFDVGSPTDIGLQSASIYESVAALSGHASKTSRATKRDLRNIADNLTGKGGLIEGNLLGKTVDFSGRTVIGVDPNLKLNEVGLPMDMARNLYRPFAVKHLIDTGKASNVLQAQKIIDNMDDDAKEAVRAAAANRPVIINRQPSLHKFSIQAFKPIIKETEDGEVVRSIHMNPLSVEGFNADFDGDQVAAHIPITSAANEEAKKLMMPSENLINPTDGRMIVVIRHEMALGIYYLTKNAKKPKGKLKAYMSYNELKRDYFNGKVVADSKVSLNGNTATAGAHLLNELLPVKYRDYKKAWTKRELERTFKRIYDDAEENDFKTYSKQDISNMIDDVKDLGFKASTTSGASIGSMDFKKIDNLDKMIQKNVDISTGDEDLDSLISGYQKVESQIESDIKSGRALSPDNPLDMMLRSGARGNPGQLRRMIGTVGVGKDVNDNLISPIKDSHFDGLSPQDFFKHSKDSRKGIFDRSVSTSKPGYLTKRLYNATQDVVVKEDDCKTRDGVMMKVSDPAIVGRILLADVVGEKNTIIAKKNDLVDRTLQNKFSADNTIKTVAVRSPLKCKTVGGVCVKCYGAMPGTRQLAKLGDAVGVMAAQAMGEPVTQMTMNTFHGGGTSSGATMGLPRVESILNLQEDKTNPATLAKVSGRVSKIDRGLIHDTIYVDDVAHKVPKVGREKQDLIKVKVGDNVRRGDFLTYGDSDDIKKGGGIVFTNANPREMFELKSKEIGSDKAVDEVTSYLTDTMSSAFEQTIGGGAIDKKHIEVIMGKMGSKAVITDAGDSNYTPGQEVDRNEIRRWNDQNASMMSARDVNVSNKNKVVGRKAAEEYRSKTGKTIVAKNRVITEERYIELKANDIKTVRVIPNPIKYEGQVTSNLTTNSGNENWFTNMGAQAPKIEIATGAALGSVDDLSSPRGSLMAGKLQPIGAGFNASKEERNKATNMSNFFKNTKKKGLRLFGL